MSDRDITSLVHTRVRALASGIRLGQFISVGAVGAAADTTVLIVLTEVVGFPPEIATLVGIETAILVMFLINEHWTFAGEGDDGRGSFLSRLKRSHVVRAAGSVTQFLVFLFVLRVLAVPLVLGDLPLWPALVAPLGVEPGSLAGTEIWYLVAKGAGIGVAMTVNYVFESLFTWQVHVE